MTYEKQYGLHLDDLLYDFLCFCWQNGAIDADLSFELNKLRQRFMTTTVRSSKEISDLTFSIKEGAE